LPGPGKYKDPGNPDTSFMTYLWENTKVITTDPIQNNDKIIDEIFIHFNLFAGFLKIHTDLDFFFRAV